MSSRRTVTFIDHNNIDRRFLNKDKLERFYLDMVNKIGLKGALKGLRQFLITESPLKMMKNAFYFALKALFVLEIFKFFS